jgi:iron complex outermembrane recepter protein
MKLLFLLLSLTFGVTVSSAAQETDVRLRGVVESGDGRPVARAMVSGGSGHVTLTDTDGRFSLRRPGTGRVLLRVSAPGFAPATLLIEAEAASAWIRVELEPGPLTIPGIEVTAAPGGHDPMTIARPTSQVGGRALERSLGGTLGQTLAKQPGLSQRYNGPAASTPVIRGLSGDRILILQDGRRVGDLSGSADDHSLSVDPLAVRRVEIVRGPASLLHGSNALGGVINVISGDIPATVPGRAEWTGSLQSESAFPGMTGSVRGEAPLGERWAMTVRAGARSAGDARIGGDTEGSRLPNSFHRNRHGAAGLGYVSSGATGGVLVEGYSTRHGVPLPPEEGSEIELEGRKVGASGRLDVNTGWAGLPTLRIAASGTSYSHEELEGESVAMAFALRTFTGDVLLRQAARGRIGDGAWGGSVMRRSYAATGEEQLTAPADAWSAGAFTYQELRIRGSATLQAGARVERSGIQSRADERFGAGRSTGFTAYSGSAGVSVPVMVGVRLGLSAARSFRSPTVEELFSRALHIGTASFEIGDPALGPEYADGVDAVIRARYPRWTGELSFFASEIRDFVHFEERGDTLIDGTRWPVLAYVQGGAGFRGFEIGAEWNPVGRLVIGVQGDAVRASLADGRPVPFTPAARIGSTARWEGPVFSLGGGARHALAQRRVGLAAEPATSAYTLFDLDAGWRHARAGGIHVLQLRVENLTNTLYRDASSRVKSFAPDPGRNVSLLYRVHF